MPLRLTDSEFEITTPPAGGLVHTISILLIHSVDTIVEPNRQVMPGRDEKPEPRNEILVPPRTVPTNDIIAAETVMAITARERMIDTIDVIVGVS